MILPACLQDLLIKEVVLCGRVPVIKYRRNDGSRKINVLPSPVK